MLNRVFQRAVTNLIDESAASDAHISKRNYFSSGKMGNGAERLEKRWRIRCYQVSIRKLNESEPLMICRKGLLVGKTTGSLHRWEDCNGQLFTGYRPTGTKAAAALYRL